MADDCGFGVQFNKKYIMQNRQQTEIKTKKLFIIIGIIAAIVVILVFLDFALGGVLVGWNNPR